MAAAENANETPPKITLTAAEFIKALKGEDERFIFNYYPEYSWAGTIIHFEHIIVEEEIVLNDKEAKYAPHLVLIGANTVFQQQFVITEGEFSSCFEIIGGNFSDLFSISGGTFSDLFSIRGGTFSSWFSISGGTFSDSFSIRGGTFSGLFSINGGTFSDSFSIRGGTFSDSFSISGGTFSGLFSINGGTFSDSFSIRGGTFSDSFSIQGGTFLYSFYLGGGIFSSGFEIEGGTFSDSFSIRGGTFSDSFYIGGGCFTKLVIFHKPEINNDFIITGGQFEKISLEPLTAIVFRMYGYMNKKLIISSFRFNKDLKKDSLVSIQDAEVHSIAWEHFINNGQCYLNHIVPGKAFAFKREVGKIVADKEGKPALEYKETPPSLTIANSDLGKTTFIDCNFSGYELNFKSSKINEVFLAGTQMPLPEHINKNDNPKNHEQNRLALSQIKKIYENRGDTVNATLYHERELAEWKEEIEQKPFSSHSEKQENLRLIYMQYKKMYELRGDVVNASLQYEQELYVKLEIVEKSHLPEGQKLYNKRTLYSLLQTMYEQRGNKVKAAQARAIGMNLYLDYINRFGKEETTQIKDDASWNERFNLWLNKITNNHGENWWRALGVAFFASAGLYTLYCLSVYIHPSQFSMALSNYFDFLNPVHKTDFFVPGGLPEDEANYLKKKVFSFWPRFIDGISRIIITYLIYQLIQAFRKYGRK